VGQSIEGGGSNVGLAELQKRLERKVDVDVVDQLLRASNNTKDVRMNLVLQMSPNGYIGLKI